MPNYRANLRLLFGGSGCDDDFLSRPCHELQNAFAAERDFSIGMGTEKAQS
jgi:hypothetical protein